MLLRDAQIAYALVDLPQIGNALPPPADDPWNERLIHRNLATLQRGEILERYP